MKHKYTIIIMFVCYLLTGCGSHAPLAGDTIIPPVPANPALNNTSGMSSLNNMNNMSSLSVPSSNMIYSLEGNPQIPVSIFADSKYLYLLRRSGSATEGSKAEKGTSKSSDIIEVYDVENASLIRTINNKALKKCSAFTVKDSNLYTYDVDSGRIILLSSSGSFISYYETGLAGLEVDKLVVTRNGRIVMKIREKTGEDFRFAILNVDTKKVSIVEAYKLFLSSSSSIPKINDFCAFGESSILVGISTGKLCLFDTETEAPQKSCVFPMDAGYIEFDGNVLYYSFKGIINLSPLNTANFSNVSSSKHIGRILINNEFTWPEKAEELDKWLLNDLLMPELENNSRHFIMTQNNKYLFFLDLVSTESKTDDKKSSGFIVYRVMK